MKYIIRSSDGTEYGPVEQDLILKWVEDGRITNDTEMRNSLMKSWTTASKIAFIQEFLHERAAAAAVEAGEVEDEGSDGPKEVVFSLNQVGHKNFQAAGPIQRTMAWLFDVILTMGIPAFGLYSVAYYWDQLGAENGASLATLILVASVFWFLLYYTVALGFKAQTIGQWFWGVMIIRPDGRPVFSGRAFMYALFYVIFLPASPVFYILSPGHRTLQEWFTGTRIIKITLRHS